MYNNKSFQYEKICINNNKNILNEIVNFKYIYIFKKIHFLIYFKYRKLNILNIFIYLFEKQN